MGTYDAAVVGGGIAGVSAAYELARAGASVIVLEREAALAHHTTGRSAAQYLENYGGEAVRRLTLASRPFFEAPPAGFADAPLLAPRPMLEVGGPDRRDAVADLARRGAAMVPSIRLVDRAEIAALCPVLRPAAAAWGAYEPEALDLDVMALHQGYVRGLRAAGGEIARSAEVGSIARDGAAWALDAAGRTLRAGLLVNAAGAWADELATRAGVAGVGLRPLRRTAFTVGLPASVDGRTWPLVHDVDEGWYFKPEGDGLLVSPADETPSDPCDARADPADVALALDRLREATTLDVRQVRSAWAGLRTFAPDRVLVLGPDPDVPTFIWCAGQGGFGIQTAPAAAQLVAAEATGSPLPAGLAAAGVSAAALAASRLRG